MIGWDELGLCEHTDYCLNPASSIHWLCDPDKFLNLSKLQLLYLSGENPRVSCLNELSNMHDA